MCKSSCLEMVREFRELSLPLTLPPALCLILFLESQVDTNCPSKSQPPCVQIVHSCSSRSSDMEMTTTFLLSQLVRSQVESNKRDQRWASHLVSHASHKIEQKLTLHSWGTALLSLEQHTAVPSWDTSGLLRGGSWRQWNPRKRKSYCTRWVTNFSGTEV